MKKIFLITMLLMLLIGGCSSSATNKSTASQLVVIEKSYSKDYKEAWIMAYDPNNSTIEKAIKIMVEEPMVWNLIERDHEYSASYYQEDDKAWVLQQIEHPGDAKTLR